MSLESTYLRRTNKVVVPGDATASKRASFATVATLDANLRTLGYALDNELALALLNKHTDEQVALLAAWLVPNLKEIKGVRRYRPMYPNFPTQVMEASAAELYLNAIMHYFGDVVGMRIIPVYDELKRPELDFDPSRVTLLRLGSKAEALDTLNAVLTQTAAWGEADRNDVLSLSVFDLVKVMAGSEKVIGNRENRAVVRNILRVHSDFGHKMQGWNRVAPDTITDVLRYAVVRSGGDVSLADKTKFRLSRRDRREIVELIHWLSSAKGNVSLGEDMLRHEGAWKRLGEVLHVGEFKQFPRVIELFADFRAGKFTTFNSRVESLASQRDPLGMARALTKRPGDFARRLDHVLRLSPLISTEVLRLFSKVGHEASPTTLVQARNAFMHRDDSDVRVFFPKGSVSKMKSIPNDRAGLSDKARAGAIDAIEKSLVKSLSDRAPLGKVWIDPSTASLAIPFGARSASKALRTVGRGSRLAFAEDTNVLRFFIWWKDAKGPGYYNRTDIDLSAVVLDDQFKNVFDVAYYNLRERGVAHSGDITSAPNGASEFIDVDIDKLRKQGGRYVLMNLLSYSGQDFLELPECFAGFMERRDLKSGEIYDPRTVTNRIDLTAASRSACPFIFDLETREAIWVDVNRPLHGQRSGYYGGYNVAKNKAALVNTVEAMVSYRPPTMYDLMRAHAIARGQIVESREDADFVFAEDGDLSPFETERVLSELL